MCAKHRIPHLTVPSVFLTLSASQKFSLPQTNRKPLPGSLCALQHWCSWLPRGFGPQKNTPASPGLWIFLTPRKIASQLGLPKFVGARNPVMASPPEEEESLSMMFVASDGEILAVRCY